MTRKPKCPNCGNKVRVKNQRRTVVRQLWECPTCLETRPREECEWTNAMIQLLLEEQEPPHAAD